jgi:anti-anti-sigma factor
VPLRQLALIGSAARVARSLVRSTHEEESVIYDAIAHVQVERPTVGTAVVTFMGEHDLATRDELTALLDGLIEENDLVVTDFSEAQFVDSTTLYVLLNADAAARARGRKLRLQLGTAAIVRTAFELSGLTKALDCVHSREEALRDGSSRPVSSRS